MIKPAIFADPVVTAKRMVAKLREAGAEVVRWIEDGASIYVCGSLQGMAPAVDQVLSERIGTEALEQLAAQRRYCRDVY